MQNNNFEKNFIKKLEYFYGKENVYNNKLFVKNLIDKLLQIDNEEQREQILTDFLIDGNRHLSFKCDLESIQDSINSLKSLFDIHEINNP